MHFLEWKWLYLEPYALEVCSQGATWNSVSINSGNDLLSNKNQSFSSHVNVLT